MTEDEDGKTIAEHGWGKARESREWVRGHRNYAQGLPAAEDAVAVAAIDMHQKDLGNLDFLRKIPRNEAKRKPRHGSLSVFIWFLNLDALL